jgi:hypothetical protein
MPYSGDVATWLALAYAAGILTGLAIELLDLIKPFGKRQRGM